MNIQGVSKNTAAQAPFRQSNPRLESLDKQISNLQKNIQDVNKNEKLDPKTKMEKVKEYQDQIQMIQQEKAQIHAEERQSKFKTAENQQPPATQDEKAGNGVLNEDVQGAFVKMDSVKNTANALGVVREQIKGELRIAESKSFSRRPGSTSKAAELREKLDKMDRTIINKASEAVNELKEAAKGESLSQEDSSSKEEFDSENTRSGTGRMEPGQFLNDEA